MADDLPTQHIIVVSEDGRKFKMVMRGSLDKLSVEKIKRYLTRSTQVDPSLQRLTHNGRVLEDDMLGEDFDLQPDDVVHLEYIRPNSMITTAPPPPPPPPPGLRRESDNAGGAYESSYSAGASGLLRDEVGRRRQAEETNAAAHRSPGTSARAPMGSAQSPATSRRYDPSAAESMYASRGPAAPPANGLPNTVPYASAVSPGPSHRARQDGYPAPPQPVVTDPEHPLLTKIAALEEDNRTLRLQLEKMKREEAQRSHLQPTQGLTTVANARANLQELSKELGLHLVFDDNLSCVVGVDETNTLILTVDPPTERLYVYSTLSTSIPTDPVLRLRLYENLLEWGMLGRDMAGGGVGVDTRSGLIMMSTSIDLKHSNPFALKDTAPVFVECLARWRAAVLAVEPPSGASFR